MQITFFIDADGTVTISDLLAEVAPVAHALAPDDPRVRAAMCSWREQPTNEERASTDDSHL